MGLFDFGEDEADVIEDLSDRLDEAVAERIKTDHVPDGRGAPEPLGDRRADLSYDHPGPGETYIEVDEQRDASARKQLNDMADDLGPGDRLLSVTDDDVAWWK